MISIRLAGAWPAVRNRFSVNSWFCPANNPQQFYSSTSVSRAPYFDVQAAALSCRGLNRALRAAIFQ